MSVTFTIDGTDITDRLRGDGWRIEMAANQGKVGTGRLVIDDITGGSNLAPLATEWSATASGATPTTIGGGYIAERGLDKGPLTAGTQRQFGPVLEDWNTALTDRVFKGSAAKRPEETDYQRVSWLLGQDVLNHLDGAGQVPNTNTVTMDATDYRGKTPLDVLDDCAESAGKNFYVYFESGTGWVLYYDKTGSTEAAFTSSLKVSDDPADIDNSTVFGPSSVDYEEDPERIYSVLNVKWANGWVYEKLQATATTYRNLQKTVIKENIKKASRARAWAQRQLAKLNEPAKKLELTVSVPESALGELRAGMRIQIKLRSRGITGFTYFRIAESVISPRQGRRGVSDVEYDVRLKMFDKLRPVNLDDTYGGGDSSGYPGTGGTPPPSRGGGADGSGSAYYVLDAFGRTEASDWGTMPDGGNAPWEGGNGWLCEENDGTGTFAVSSSVATMTMTMDASVLTAGLYTNEDEATNYWGPWTTGSASFLLKFKTSVLGDTADTDANTIELHVWGEGLYCGAAVHLGDNVAWSHMDPDQQRGISLMSDFDTYTGFTAKTIAADTWYYVRLDLTGDTMRVRLWPTSDQEPVAWDLSANKVDGTPTDSGLVVYGRGNDTMVYSFDEIDAALAASGGEPVNRTLPSGDGATVTWQIEPFVGGISVWVDGISTPLSSFDRDAGTITFDRAPDLGAIIRVEYTPE